VSTTKRDGARVIRVYKPSLSSYSGGGGGGGEGKKEEKNDDNSILGDLI